MSIPPNFILFYIVKLGYLNCVILDKSSEDIDRQKYKLFLQSSQDKVNNVEDLPINLSLLLSSQKKSVLLKINPDI